MDLKEKHFLDPIFTILGCLWLSLVLDNLYKFRKLQITPENI